MCGKGSHSDRECRDTQSLKMAEKKAFVLRIDPALLAKVEKWAADEFRSTNGQIEWIIRNALKKAGKYREKESGTP